MLSSVLCSVVSVLPSLTIGSGYEYPKARYSLGLLRLSVCSFTKPGRVVRVAQQKQDA